MNNMVKQILKEYLKYYPTEENKLNQLKEFIEKNEDIYNSKNVIGHLTASGYIYAKNEKKILLLEHKKLNRFLQPGGHSEKIDNSLLDTAKREIYEETHLNNLELISISSNKNIPFDINTHFIPENPMKDMPAHYHHDFRYLFIVNNTKDIIIDTKESNSYQWFDIQELENDSKFRDIINKIYNIMNSNFKVKRYYSKIIENLNINLDEYESIVVSHIIPDCIDYLEALNLICPIKILIPKPNSIDQQTFNKIESIYNIKKITRNEINNNSELDDLIKSSNKKIIIFDIGGYFSEYINEKQSICKNIKFIIEDTENGYQKYENIKSNIKIVSVARSVLKENEDYLVGESVLFSADNILRDMGHIIEYMNCGVIGFGKIGSSIASHLIQRGIKGTVFDKNPIKQVEAFNRLCNIDNKENIIKNSDVIFLATGNHSLDINDFRKIKKGAYVFSVTSSDDEINDLYLETEYKVKQINLNVYKYENRCNYFYLIRKGNAVNFINNAVMDNFIHLVRSEMLVAANMLSNNSELIKNNENNIQELPEKIRKRIAETWLEIFADGKF